jgi:hypothetical protein
MIADGSVAAPVARRDGSYIGRVDFAEGRREAVLFTHAEVSKKNRRGHAPLCDRLGANPHGERRFRDERATLPAGPAASARRAAALDPAAAGGSAGGPRLSARARRSFAARERESWGSGWIDDDYLDRRLANLRRFEESRLREVLPQR